jgi:hypothetical protein
VCALYGRKTMKKKAEIPSEDSLAGLVMLQGFF